MPRRSRPMFKLMNQASLRLLGAVCPCGPHVLKCLVGVVFAILKWAWPWFFCRQSLASFCQSLSCRLVTIADLKGPDPFGGCSTAATVGVVITGPSFVKNWKPQGMREGDDITWSLEIFLTILSKSWHKCFWGARLHVVEWVDWVERWLNGSKSSKHVQKNVCVCVRHLQR